MAYGPKPKPIHERFWSKVCRGQGCWEWIGMRSNGYGRFRINNPRRKELAHRMAWILTYGSIPDGMVIRHKCDNTGCCNPDHLEIGTQSDNMKDMWERGRHYSQRSN